MIIDGFITEIHCSFVFRRVSNDIISSVSYFTELNDKCLSPTAETYLYLQDSQFLNILYTNGVAGGGGGCFSFNFKDF